MEDNPAWRLPFRARFSGSQFVGYPDCTLREPGDQSQSHKRPRPSPKNECTRSEEIDAQRHYGGRYREDTYVLASHCATPHFGVVWDCILAASGRTATFGSRKELHDQAILQHR